MNRHNGSKLIIHSPSDGAQTLEALMITADLCPTRDGEQGPVTRTFETSARFCRASL